MQMLGGREGGSDERDLREEEHRQRPVPAAERAASPAEAGDGSGFAGDFDDDIPFTFIGRGISGHAI